MKAAIYMVLCCCFLLSFVGDAHAQNPKNMSPEELHALIMSRNHIHTRYHEFPATVPKPIKRGHVEIGTELYEQWQGTNGWYYCYPQDGECFDRKGLGVDSTGACWADAKHKCTTDAKKRDISYFYKEFRKRGDLGPPMTLTNKSIRRSPSKFWSKANFLGQLTFVLYLLI